MRGSLIISVVLHVAVVLVAIFGLPFSPDPVDIPPPMVEVEIVTDIEEKSPEPEAEAPKPAPKPTPAPPPPPPTPPAPAPEPMAEAKPEPEPQPDPEPEVEPVPVEKPKPPEPEKPKPKPEPKSQPVEKPQSVVKMPRPQTKPKEPPRNDFTSVLKTVEKLKDKPPVPKTEQKPEKKEEEKPLSFEEQMAQALKKQPTPSRKDDRPPQPGARLTDSEMDAVKRQIAGCWNIQPGARDAENLVVRLRVLVNPDMSVRQVDIMDNGESQNPFWSAASRSARTAVLKCSPLQLPPGKYDVWQVINFTFDPKSMF